MRQDRRYREIASKHVRTGCQDDAAPHAEGRGQNAVSAGRFNLERHHLKTLIESVQITRPLVAPATKYLPSHPRNGV
jgi:hypothetical protein